MEIECGNTTNLTHDEFDPSVTTDYICERINLNLGTEETNIRTHGIDLTPVCGIRERDLEQIRKRSKIHTVVLSTNGEQVNDRSGVEIEIERKLLRGDVRVTICMDG